MDDLVEILTHALHSTQTASGWYGQPECADVGEALAPHVQALLAQAWMEGAFFFGGDAAEQWYFNASGSECNPYTASQDEAEQ